MNIKTVLENLIGFFAKEEIDFALIGAFALQAYGYVRATRDIDFVVRGGGQERVVRFLESLGYETSYRSRGFSSHVHPVNWRNSMSLPGGRNKLLDLESGLALTPEDFKAMKICRGGHDLDLTGYIMWLEEIGAFKTRKADAKIYPERFEL